VYDPPVLVSDFDFELPPDLIAQYPVKERSESRLMVLDRRSRHIAHARTRDLARFLCSGDLLVVNDTLVYPARLHGRRVPSGGAVECLLLRQRDADTWDALVHPGQKLRPGSRLLFERGGARLNGEVVARGSFGRRTVRLWRDDDAAVEDAIDVIGDVPLPPYIKRPLTEADRERYQTVYARARGSVAAPTAGLHLTRELMSELEAKGVERTAITLHVGYGTFQPVRTEIVEEHRIDPERWSIENEAARAVNEALDRGRRVVAVGTTTTRTLEAVAGTHGGRIVAGHGEADLFIRPGYQFHVIGALLTNFHLPRSSLLMLVAAFGGRELVLSAYREAVEHRYRFYSYGDAMLVV
jgi:S-adenosylmethionine:tRNA ribosyltransferase-isomerase